MTDDDKQHQLDVSIAGAILWVLERVVCRGSVCGGPVSIAGAILWVLERHHGPQLPLLRACFNRGGDSLGVGA